jgi:hypothetical protein
MLRARVPHHNSSLAPSAERPEWCLYQPARIFGKFLANGFLSEGTSGGRSENGRINTGDLWWAWVDLNHRPRPYQDCGRSSPAKGWPC